MPIVKSQRANKLLETPVFFSQELMPQMKRYPDDQLKIWALMEIENGVVKTLSYFGEVENFERVILEASGKLLQGRPLSSLDSLTVRECEAFLRDRNSENSIEGLEEKDEARFKKFFQWMRAIPHSHGAQDYEFASQKGPFRELKLVDKVKELKAFLNSKEVISLYGNRSAPELIDVDGLTVFVQAPYHSEEDRSLFEELHVRGVEAFQEEMLNFIPEN
jgi:hypothetical protein